MANSLTLRIKALVSGAKDVLGLSKNVDTLGKESTETAKETEQLNRSLNENEGATKRSGAEAAKTSDKLRKQRAALRDAGNQADKTSKKMGGLSGVMRGLAGALATRAFVKANVDLESLSRGLEAVFGSAEAAANELAYVRDIAGSMGVKVGDATKAYLDLAAAAKGTALEGAQTRRIFESVSLAMGRLGKSSADTRGALTAIQQMMSKGRVSAEELRQQLGERLPGAFQIAADAVGVTTAELDKMLSTGQLTAEQMLPNLATELNRLYAGGEINTLTANWNRLINSLQLFSTEAGKSSNGVSLMADGLRALTTLVNFVNVGLTSLIEYTKAAGRAFYEFIRLVSFSRSFDDFKKNVDSAFSAAEKRIAETADAVFGLDRNLQRVTKSATDAAAATKSVADAGKDLAASAQEQVASAVVLAEQLRAINELQALGVITEQQAIENKRLLTAAYQKQLPVIEKSAEVIENITLLLSASAKSAKTAAELDRAQAQAIRELSNNTEQFGVVMGVVLDRRRELADETRNQTIETLKSARADAQNAESSFDLALAMVRLIEQKKRLNDLFKSGNITQQQYNKQAEELQTTIEAIAEKQKQQAESQKEASKQTAKSAEATGKATERQKTFNEAVTDTGSVMGKMIAHLKFWQDEMDGISEAARRAFDQMVEASNRAGGALVTSFDASAEAAQSNSAEIASLSRQLSDMRSAHARATGDVNRWMIAVEAAGLAAKRAYLLQDEAIKGLEKNLENATTLTEEQAEAAKTALVSYGLLDKARLDGLRSQIDQIRAATEAMNDSAVATLTGLQNELDRMSGNLTAIEQRNYEQKRLQLLEQLNAAQEAGDAKAIAALQKSLALLERIHNIKIANLEVDKESANVSSTTTRKSAQFGGRSARGSSQTSGDAASVSGDVVTTINLDGKQIARVVQPYFSEFGRLSG